MQRYKKITNKHFKSIRTKNNKTETSSYKQLNFIYIQIAQYFDQNHKWVATFRHLSLKNLCLCVDLSFFPLINFIKDWDALAFSSSSSSSLKHEQYAKFKIFLWYETCCMLIFFLAFDFCRSAWSFGFFIPATTANDLRHGRIFYPDFIHYIYFPTCMLMIHIVSMIFNEGAYLTL